MDLDLVIYGDILIFLHLVERNLKGGMKRNWKEFQKNMVNNYD
jgi:hypothetical protein